MITSIIEGLWMGEINCYVTMLQTHSLKHTKSRWLRRGASLIEARRKYVEQISEPFKENLAQILNETLRGDSLPVKH